MRHELRALLRLLGQHRWRYSLGALFLCVSDGGQVTIGWLVGRAVDAFGRASGSLASGPAPTAFAARLEGFLAGWGPAEFARAIVIAALCVTAARFCWRHMIFGSARRIERRLRQRLYEHMERLGASFYLDRKVGELMAYATNDVPAVQMSAGPGMMSALDTVIQFTVAGSMMALTVHPRLALVALVPLLALAPTSAWLGRRMHARFTDVQATFGEVSDVVHEDIAGVRVVKGYAREAEQLRRFDESSQKYRARMASLLRYDSAFEPLIGLLAGLAAAVGLAYGGLLVVGGEISVGAFVAFNSFLALLVWPMIAFGRVVNLFQRGMASIGRLNTLFAIPPGITDAPDAVAIPQAEGHLRLRDLTFRYRPELAPALAGIDVDIAPGETLGILGRTGSGKSTLANLIVRAFDPPAGTVFIDGHDVLKVRLADLRRNIAYVPQDPFLFSRTIEENIAFEPVPHTLDEVRSAAAAAGLDRDIVGFAEGYDTLLGERGITLSGGQRQRLCLARALIRDVPFLVLDDCLSAVDTETEAAILANLKPIAARRTTLIIAHRVSAVQHADEIILLEQGRIIERGTHAALVEAGGAYAKLYRRQQLEAGLGGEAGVDRPGLKPPAGSQPKVVDGAAPEGPRALADDERQAEAADG